MSDKNNDYYKLKRKLFLYILVIVIAAIVFVFYLRELMRWRAGEWIVRFLESSFYLERQDAMIIYQYTIRNNITIFMYVTIAVTVLVLCRIMLSKFAKYFNEINNGIDILIQKED